jgi:hypothetical protein
MLVGFGCCEACDDQLEQNLYDTIRAHVTHTQHIGLALTGAPQIAAIILGFAIGRHALMNGEYWTVAGDPLLDYGPMSKEAGTHAIAE